MDLLPIAILLCWSSLELVSEATTTFFQLTLNHIPSSWATLSGVQFDMWLGLSSTGNCSQPTRGVLASQTSLGHGCIHSDCYITFPRTPITFLTPTAAAETYQFCLGFRLPSSSKNSLKSTTTTTQWKAVNYFSSFELQSRRSFNFRIYALREGRRAVSEGHLYKYHRRMPLAQSFLFHIQLYDVQPKWMHGSLQVRITADLKQGLEQTPLTSKLLAVRALLKKGCRRTLDGCRAHAKFPIELLYVPRQFTVLLYQRPSTRWWDRSAWTFVGSVQLMPWEIVDRYPRPHDLRQPNGQDSLGQAECYLSPVEL